VNRHPRQTIPSSKLRKYGKKKKGANIKNLEAKR
jgi:hypothetical protein